MPESIQITAIVSGLLTLVAGALSLITTYLAFSRGRRQRQRELAERGLVSHYGDRVQELSKELKRASAEFDAVLQEMTEVSQDRGQVLERLESRLNQMKEREKEMQDRIQALEGVPLPAMEYFLQAMEKGERRSALRDYLLFGAGVVVSTFVALILSLLL